MSLLIRADANARIGTGHLMRCLALAQGWKARGGRATFITACESEGLRQRLSDEGSQVITLERSYPDPADWEVTSEVLATHSDAWVVLDGYHFDPKYQRKIVDAGHQLLVIDDVAHLNHYYADVVLNQNINARQLRYTCEPNTCLLLGTRYVLLRSEFLSQQRWQRKIPKVARRVLVTLGGVDPANVALKAIKALQLVETKKLEAVVVTGMNDMHYGKLLSITKDSLFPIRLESNVKNMPELMAWADVALSAGGSTTWELAFMGLPSVLLVLADNQRPVAASLHAAGVATNLGWHVDLTAESIADAVTQLMKGTTQREEMAQRGRRLVDGEGAARVLKRIEEKTLRLRRVREDDCRLLWRWANDPGVREVSFSPEPITWEDHVHWFKTTIEDPHCVFSLAVNNEGVPIGQVRSATKGDDAVISLSIDSKFRDQGYGTTMIRQATWELFGSCDVSVIHAYVKWDNNASIRAFVKAGFKDIGMMKVKGQQAIHLTLERATS